jgi:hypothetical protein
MPRTWPAPARRMEQNMSLFDVDSAPPLPPLFDKAFQDTREAVCVARLIWVGTFDPYQSNMGWLPPPSLSDKLKPENLGATLQELKSALRQAEASIKKVDSALTGSKDLQHVPKCSSRSFETGRAPFYQS